MQAIDEFCAALASSEGQPRATYSGLERLAQRLVGAKLFSLMLVDEASATATRIYTSNEDAYPVSGTKAFPRNEWATTVLSEGRTFVANSIDEIRAVFPDHEVIRSLGCESVLNVPVILGGSVAGTINCLHGPGHYSVELVQASQALKVPGAAAVLLAMADASAPRADGA